MSDERKALGLNENPKSTQPRPAERINHRRSLLSVAIASAIRRMRRP